ncbi:MAG: aminotransferase class I/II-fold pyridoxal phosphate-dependent enzyme, partial [Paracoccus sp. (in: a-proteobacteria)]|nr:aminotransferase class I/II-fold pyridoxal phosphate-dependent enzyme [Paracoccus sp. (in: a-proteobacteria)]
MSKDQTPLHPRTRAIHHGIRRSQYGEMAEALFMTQGFVYDSAAQAEARFQKVGPDEFIYARYGNPTSRMFEDRIAEIEGTEDAFATASGMAAVNGAMMSLVKPGDKVVAARALFGSCLYVLDILARFGVQVTLVDGTDLDQWAEALKGGAQAVFFESVSNPTLEIIDMAEVCRLAHEAGATVVCDNVFATPVFSRAVELGVDVVVYSATKHIDGTGRALGGVICGTRDFVRNVAEPYLKHTGGAISPFNAWLMLSSIGSMDLRVRAQADAALAVAQALDGHPALTRLIYPGLP